MSFSEILKPRPEVLSDEGIDGIIDLANLDDPKGKKLEANPKRFLNLTYPTADVRRVIQALSDRFSGKKDVPGLFIFEGLKGSGKSHLLLMIYHLFKNYRLADEWLDVHKMYFQLPDNAVIVINKFTDLPLFSIWDFIFEQLTDSLPEKNIVQPGFNDIEKVLRDKRLILILDELEKNRLRYILSPRKLSQEERHLLFHGIPMRNQVILLEPKDPDFNLDKNKDLIKWAQRQLAARDLAGTTKDSSRRAEYERIEKEDKQNSIEAIKRAGLSYIQWEHYGNTAGEDRIEEEVIPRVSGEDVRKHISQQLFPPQLFEEHISARLNDVLDLSVKDVDRKYRSIIGFPVPVTVRSVSQALRDLCRNKKMSIKHPRGNFCGENPNLTETELFEAKVGEPFEPPSVPPEGYVPGEEEKPEEQRPLSDEKPPSEPDIQPTQELRIAPQEEIGSLRQAVAQRLQEYPDSKITRIRATIFFEKGTNDLSTIPAYIRGSLSGRGSVTTEIIITKEGEFTKGEVESIVESLPSIPEASYEARLDLIMPATGEEAEDEESSDR